VTKNNDTIEKINLLQLKKERKKLGQKSEAGNNSKKNNPKLKKNEVIAKKTDWLQLKKEKKELRQKRKAKRLNI